MEARPRIETERNLKKEKPILVVDDDVNIRNLLKTFFEKEGYKVFEAHNGHEAVEMVRTNEISSVLLDIEMPVMDGLQTLPKLLEINPHIGVVMTTGLMDDERVKKALSLGAYNYVIKPFDFLYLELVVMSRLAITN
jgi:two-component system response regulator (stage 0 sporulation protein F)